MVVSLCGTPRRFPRGAVDLSLIGVIGLLWLEVLAVKGE